VQVQYKKSFTAVKQLFELDKGKYLRLHFFRQAGKIAEQLFLTG
jgi:hypothetical protein